MSQFEVNDRVGRFTGKAVGDHAIHTQIAVAGRSDGHVLKQVEHRFGFKQTFEMSNTLLSIGRQRIHSGPLILLGNQRQLGCCAAPILRAEALRSS